MHLRVSKDFSLVGLAQLRKWEEMTIRDRTWAPHRAALLSVWASIYISAFVLFISIQMPETGNETLRLAVISVAVATIGLVALRKEGLREPLFEYFDWVAGQAKLNWFSAIVMIIFFAFMMIVLSV